MEAEDLGSENELQKSDKPKRERTPAQIEAFEKARAKRIENAKIKNEKINEIKQQSKTKTLPTVMAKPEIQMSETKKPKTEGTIGKTEKTIGKKEPKIIYQDESESEEEVIIVKKKKKQPPKKKVIYEEESSEEEEEEVQSSASLRPPPPPQATPKHTPVNPQIQSRQFIRFF